MYVNKGDDKIKQLHADIGRTIPKEDLKLGQKMKGGGKTKKNISAQIKKAKKTNYPKVPSKAELPELSKLPKNTDISLKRLKDLLKKHRPKDWEKYKEREKDPENEKEEIIDWMNYLFPPKPKPKPNYSKEQNIAQGGKVKKKYSYRRGGMATLRKPKRG